MPRICYKLVYGPRNGTPHEHKTFDEGLYRTTKCDHTFANKITILALYIHRNVRLRTSHLTFIIHIVAWTNFDIYIYPLSWIFLLVWVEKSFIIVISIPFQKYTMTNKYYHAGVLRFSLGSLLSPAYLFELFEYLYVGGKYIFPSFQPLNTCPLLCSIWSCNMQIYSSHEWIMILK